jgi:hypothetical protein
VTMEGKNKTAATTNSEAIIDFNFISTPYFPPEVRNVYRTSTYLNAPKTLSNWVL